MRHKIMKGANLSWSVTIRLTSSLLAAFVPEKRAHRIVFANEKGGTGKSTTAVHVAVALSYLGAKVAALDLDPVSYTHLTLPTNREV